MKFVDYIQVILMRRLRRSLLIGIALHSSITHWRKAKQLGLPSPVSKLLLQTVCNVEQHADLRPFDLDARHRTNNNIPLSKKQEKLGRPIHVRFSEGLGVKLPRSTQPYVNICGTFYYLCSVLDGCSRYIVHWDIRESMMEADVEVIIQRAWESFPGQSPRIISDNGPVPHKNSIPVRIDGPRGQIAP